MTKRDREFKKSALAKKISAMEAKAGKYKAEIDERVKLRAVLLRHVDQYKFQLLELHNLEK